MGTVEAGANALIIGEDSSSRCPPIIALTAYQSGSVVLAATYASVALAGSSVTPAVEELLGRTLNGVFVNSVSRLSVEKTS